MCVVEPILYVVFADDMREFNVRLKSVIFQHVMDLELRNGLERTYRELHGWASLRTTGLPGSMATGSTDPSLGQLRPHLVCYLANADAQHVIAPSWFR